MVATRKSWSTLQTNLGRTEDARRLFRTVIIATEVLDARNTRKWFCAIVVATKHLYAACWRQRLGAIVVAAALANTIRNINPVQEVVADSVRGP